MDSSPLVSVIIPFLNEESYLQEAIDSVFAQSYDTWELLLVDDGSDDASSRTALECARQNPGRVKYLEHEGHASKGLSASRNLGINHSTGGYLAFLDADDIWLSDKLADQVAILEAHPEAGMVYGRSLWWSGWDGTATREDQLYDLGVPAGTVLHPPSLLEPFFISQTAAIPNPSSIMLRRELVEKIGGFEERFRDLYEDQVFYSRVVLNSPVIASESCWDYYRQHPRSVTAIGNQEGREVVARLEFLEWLAEYLDSLGEARFWRATRKEIWSLRHPRWRSARQRLVVGTGSVPDSVLNLTRRVTPAGIRARFWSAIYGRDYVPPADLLRWGDLRRLTPLSREFGYDRGRPVDRYYIEEFLDSHRGDVRGRVLEIADDTYTRRFGGSAVSHSDVLTVAECDPSATIVADLTDAPNIPADSFDCVILTQTLQVVYDVRAVVRTLYRILKPGGVVLVTAPGISQISRYDMDRWGHYWSFTSLSLRRMFAEVFPEENVSWRSYGNVLAATAFLQGMAMEELKRSELEYTDPDYEVIIGIRARKSGDANTSARSIAQR
jgi:glycosyltransferase involved in cell wall biosynthesis